VVTRVVAVQKKSELTSVYEYAMAGSQDVREFMLQRKREWMA
jgi:hypothetical protein